MMESEKDQTEWDLKLSKDLDALSKVPSNLLHQGITDTQKTKSGETITSNSQFFYWEYGSTYSERIPCANPGNGISHYLIAENESGEIIGTRISTIFDDGNKLIVRSRIKVRDKGKGLATPIENSFIKSLQRLANTQNKKVVWNVTNENLDTLEEYRKELGADPVVVAQMEAEQERWQSLYGEDGKFGIMNGKREFLPEANQDIPEFFHGKVEHLTSAEFLKRIEARRPDLSKENISRAIAYQYSDENDEAVILVCTDRLPEQYIKYVLTHEIWEHEVANRKGYNLVDRARNDVRTFLQTQLPSIKEEQVDAIFNRFVNEYRFDYKHEFAIWKEYSLAEEEGNLTEYHEFVMDLRKQDLDNYSHDATTLRKTQRDIEIRKSIFRKIKEGSKHQFKHD